MGRGELAAKGKALVLTLGAELKALDVPPEVPGGTSMAQVSAAAEVVMHGATKLQMLLADGTDVPEEAADAMLQDFHGQIVAFLAYASSALGSQGVTFDACVRDAARLVSNSCANLVSVATGHADAPTPELVKPALAEVWAACGALKKLPRDGRAAVSKALLRSAAVVKDVASELAEIGAGADAGAADDDDDDEATRRGATRHEDDMTFSDDDFDENEMRVAKACGVFAQASFGFLRALVSPIVRGTGVSDTENEALENALRECVAFQRAVEEVGAGAYPPQDADALAADARAAVARAQGMGQAVAQAGDAEAAAEATAAFEVAHETLVSAIEA
jgi:hypothetical protein